MNEGADKPEGERSWSAKKIEDDPELLEAERLNQQSFLWERYYVTGSFDDLAAYIEAGGDIEPNTDRDGVVYNNIRKALIAILRGEMKRPNGRSKKWKDLEFYIQVCDVRTQPPTTSLEKIFDDTPLGVGVSWDGFTCRYQRGLKIARSLGIE